MGTKKIKPVALSEWEAGVKIFTIKAVKQGGQRHPFLSEWPAGVGGNPQMESIGYIILSILAVSEANKKRKISPRNC